jgi:hypothetical protein
MKNGKVANWTCFRGLGGVPPPRETIPAFSGQVEAERAESAECPPARKKPRPVGGELHSYVDSYHVYRTHRALDMDTPVPRPVHPPELGPVRAVPEVGGLHHHYEWRAA